MYNITYLYMKYRTLERLTYSDNIINANLKFIQHHEATKKM